MPTNRDLNRIAEIFDGLHSRSAAKPKTDPFDGLSGTRFSVGLDTHSNVRFFSSKIIIFVFLFS